MPVRWRCAGGCPGHLGVCAGRVEPTPMTGQVMFAHVSRSRLMRSAGDAAGGCALLWHGHFHKVCRSALPALPEPVRHRLSLPARSAAQQHCSTAQADGMRLDPVHFSMLVIGVSFACYAPSLNSLQDQAYRSTVVIEGEVRSSPENVSSREPYSVNVKVLDVWPVNSGGLEREQLVTVGDFGSEAPCTTVEKDHRYIFFMDPTAEPLVFKASYAPVDASEPELKKDVERVLCEDCGKFKALPL
ncbi:hypothetical protein Q8A73_010490 [Channa argus]|nr:hypothetical protein Q8A73_010490 [Channa argus]